MVIWKLEIEMTVTSDIFPSSSDQQNQTTTRYILHAHKDPLNLNLLKF